MLRQSNQSLAIIGKIVFSYLFLLSSPPFFFAELDYIIVIRMVFPRVPDSMGKDGAVRSTDPFDGVDQDEGDLC
jgi:hypothetical protein